MFCDGEEESPRAREYIDFQFPPAAKSSLRQLFKGNNKVRQVVFDLSQSAPGQRTIARRLDKFLSSPAAA
jgi:hypothetical protein